MKSNEPIEFLYKKLYETLDYDFLSTHPLPSNSGYYLACLSEVVYRLKNEQRKFDSVEEAWECVKRIAEICYDSLDFSPLFDTIEPNPFAPSRE
jgi:hypothetical protein